MSDDHADRIVAPCGLPDTAACPFDARAHEDGLWRENLATGSQAHVVPHAHLADDQTGHWTEAGCNEILRAAPVAMLVMNRQGRIAQANARAEAMFGYAAGGMSNLVIEDLIPERFRGAHEDYRRHPVEVPPRHRVMGMPGGDFFGLRADGGEFPVEIGLGTVEMQGERFTVVSINEITERKQIEDDLRIAAIAFETQSGMIVMKFLAPHWAMTRLPVSPQRL